MKSSCYALTWLLGSLACGLLVVGSASGQIPPRAPTLDEAASIEADCPASPTLDEVPPPVAGGDRPVPPGWTSGPLGVLPYDEEYNCDIPSENPLGLPEPAISALVIQQELDDEVRIFSSNDSPAELPRFEELPFRVLGFGDTEIADGEEMCPEPNLELQVMDLPSVADVERASSAELLRGVARTLLACGGWLQNAADVMDQGATETAD